ncbi:MAG: gliding motility-associated ABC transporter substrate-binding protein GldG [Flavobacteriales bacterium]|nr:gliding motility-associated ABC transporter substrate-binding protein GldG [Flavobacteriales bacterium]
MKRNSPKFRHILEVLIAIALILVINIIGNVKFARLDLTEDKLHTLSPKTIDFLENEIDQVINIEVYLDGEFPAFIQKLKNTIKEKIEEFQAYAGKKVKFRFINPNEDKELAKDLKQQLAELGLYPSFILSKEEGSEEFTEIWAGAKILYGEKQQAIQFLPGGNFLVSPAHVNDAINQLEYNFVKAFWQLTNETRDNIAFLRGHGELTNAEAWSIQYELKQFYNVDTVQIIDSTGKENLKALDKFQSVVIAKPTKSFNEKEKYIIDQYVMKGGKVFWLIDNLDVPEDSLAISEVVHTFQYDLNLDDMLFKYGARVNKNLVADINSGPIMRKNSYKVLDHWFLYPTLTNQNTSELTHNVAPIKIRYGSTVEAVGSKDIKKTVILETSKNYKVLPARFRISYGYNQHGYRPIDSLRTDSDATKPLALLLEGEFTSHYKGRITDKYVTDPAANYIEKSKSNKMVIIGDGDLIRNELGMSEKGQLLPYGLQFEPLVRDQNNQVATMYGNGIFFTNLMDRMMGNEHLISLRSRMKTVRLLNREEVSLNRKSWQTFNLTIPVILVVLLGLLQWYIRRRKFAVK